MCGNARRGVLVRHDASVWEPRPPPNSDVVENAPADDAGEGGRRCPRAGEALDSPLPKDSAYPRPDALSADPVARG